MPVRWGTDGWPPLAHYDEIGYMMPVKSPSEGLAGLFMLIVHPFLTGRLALWRLVESWITQTLETRDVWFATLGGIADNMDSLTKRGAWSPSIETLPFFEAPPLQGAQFVDRR